MEGTMYWQNSSVVEKYPFFVSLPFSICQSKCRQTNTQASRSSMSAEVKRLPLPARSPSKAPSMSLGSLERPPTLMEMRPSISLPSGPNAACKSISYPAICEAQADDTRNKKAGPIAEIANLSLRSLSTSADNLEGLLCIIDHMPNMWRSRRSWQTKKVGKQGVTWVGLAPFGHAASSAAGFAAWA